MALKDVQLATVSPPNRTEKTFDVTAHSDDGNKRVTFKCTTEAAAVALRNAIREHADSLWNVADYSMGR